LSTKKPKPGDRVMIYHDPKTKTNSDQEVTLVEKFHDFSGGLEHWWVRYDGDDTCYLRLIKGNDS